MFYALSLLQNIHSAGGALSAFIAVLGVAFSLWMAFDCWKRGGDPYWIWLILCSGGIFAAIYFFTQYWSGCRFEYNLWKRLAAGGRIRDLRLRAAQLKTAPAYEALGDSYADVKKYAEAEAAYRQALKLQPGFFDAQVQLGYVLVELDRAADAWPLLQPAYEAKPDYDSDRLLWTLARCQTKRGELEAARPLYELFLTKHSYSEAQLEYADLLVKLGEEGEGRALIEELLADIAASPRYTQSRERKWARGARKMLRALPQAAA
ncbi:MAG: tetratricopeptide repeat protein [Chthoniobacterales bacterium]